MTLTRREQLDAQFKATSEEVALATDPNAVNQWLRMTGESFQNTKAVLECADIIYGPAVDGKFRPGAEHDTGKSFLMTTLASVQDRITGRTRHR